MNYSWQPNTNYIENTIVYPSETDGFYYVCIKAGKSSSNTVSLSAKTEPVWQGRIVVDNNLIWSRIPYNNNSSFSTWEPGKIYHLGDKIVPTGGPVEINGGLYSYILHEINAEPDWPHKDSVTIADNEVIWQAKISSLQFIPKDLRSDLLYVEFYLLVDYLLQNPDLSFRDSFYKHRDHTKLSYNSLYDFISEKGYSYITDVLSLSQDQLLVLSEYLNLIHALKGTKEGLKLVLDLLGIAYLIEEWWEKDPKDEPHTFTMEINFDLGNVKADSTTRIKNFVEHYVFPKLKSITVNYSAKMAETVVYMAGIVEKEYYGEIYESVLININVIGHIETTYSGIISTPEVTSVTFTEEEIPLYPENKIIVLF